MRRVLVATVLTSCFAMAGEVSGEAEIALVPVAATGSHSVAGDEIILDGGGQRVTLEIFISGWSPDLLRSYQMPIDSSGYSSGIRGVLTPASVPCMGVCVGGLNIGSGCGSNLDCGNCVGGDEAGKACGTDLDCRPTGVGVCEGSCDLTEADIACRSELGGVCRGFTLTPGAPCVLDSECPDILPGVLVGTCAGPRCAFPLLEGGLCEPGYILPDRLDFVFFGVGGGSISVVDSTTLNYRFAATVVEEDFVEEGDSPLYAGTLEVEVPVDAIGTFTVGFLREEEKGLGSILTNEGRVRIEPLTLTPARITILETCFSPADCDDGNACTTDTCVCPGGICKNATCAHDINFDDTSLCCSPTTGATCPIPASLPADFDLNGTSDLFDAAIFNECFMQVPLTGVCVPTDVDCDCDADHDDWNLIAPLLNGPGGP